MNATETKSKRAMIQHSAEEKCRAVLSVWSERRKVSQVCKELGIHGTVLYHWQNRAMEAMLRGLEPKTQSAAAAATLAPRLQKLLAQRVLKREGKVAKLHDRLEKIQQQAKPQVKPN